MLEDAGPSDFGEDVFTEESKKKGDIKLRRTIYTTKYTHDIDGTSSAEAEVLTECEEAKSS